MAALAKEVRILLTGPESRFFLAYKPTGWYLNAPFSQKGNDAVMAPVVATKLGIDLNKITFPSKLTASQSGIVIGCTDDAMHKYIRRLLESGKCNMTYQCIIHANKSYKALVAKSKFKHSFRCFNHKKEITTGKFNIEVKSIKQHPKHIINNIPNGVLKQGIAQLIAMSNTCIVKDIPSHSQNGSMESSTEKSNLNLDTRFQENCHTIEYTMQNLKTYLNSNTKSSKMAKYRYMEISTNSQTINRNIAQVLAALGLIVVNKNINSSHNAVNTMCLQLCTLQLQHPIHKQQIVEAKLHKEKVLPKEWMVTLHDDET
ncbi:hypothetical protein BBOV_II006250 [Babesia bovis T2Bo]|uniref:Pseudouridine synthase RsuA/RluA-like domain-containing protein n=1 Tax=Babesia bovis TaxID=5865 RepID=A7AUG4_BABBO|nr:hypothetical protein BBOV_II006250 [Babesia bovis T2Bo]EDO06575.1 hypothetical protein BBOV_II006250 [Babesia bovis T2Bo]|eukprot:XP_001610143.1 hypothetical protein [Babesia bovis T2Bo]